MDFKKLYSRIRDIDQGKRSVVAECNTPSMEAGGMPPPMAAPQIPPVSMNMNLTAQGVDQIKEILSLMSQPAEKAEPVSMAIPMPAPKMDKPMDEPADIPPASDDPLPKLGMKKPEEDLSDLMNLAGVAFGKKEAVDGDTGPKTELGKMADEVRDMADELADANKKEEGYANEPDEKYNDIDYMTKDLAGGLNGPKGTYPKVADGDNPMQKVKESIRTQLDKRYRELKGQ
jgi:hypothetical protein